MKKKMKWLRATLMIMLLSLFGSVEAAVMAVPADEEETVALAVGDTVEWESVQYVVLTLDGYDGTVALSGAYITVSELVIPGTFSYGDYSLMVTAIQSASTSTWDEGQQNVTSLVIPGTVASIEDYAFYGGQLTSLTILDSDTALVLPQYCFAANYSLSGTIEIPSRVTEVGTMCFYGCYSISEVTLNEGLETIGGGAFDNIDQPKSITIPSTVTNIGLGAFTYWDNLKEIYCHAEEVPTTDSGSGSSIFNYWKGDIYSTAHLHVPEGTADAYAAADYWQFETIIEGDDEIEPDTLQVGDEITVNSVNYIVETLDESTGTLYVNTSKPSGEVTIPGTISYSDDVTTYTLTVDSIKTRALSFATAMTAVTIPNTIRGIGNYAFLGCTGLVSVTFDEGGSYALSDGCFSGCTSLTSVTMPDWLETIPSLCFSSDTKLETVTFNEGLTYITKDAFRDCSAITEVTIPSTVTSVNGFRRCSGITSLTLSEGITEIETNAFDGCTSLTSVTFPSTVITICGFQECTGLSSVVIPDATTTLGDYVFYGCTSLTDIEFGSGLQSIGSYAFGKTGITSIDLPDALPAIGEYAFYSSDLVSIDIPDSVLSIGFAAFAGCGSLKRVYLPEELTEIGYMAFSECNALTDLFSYTVDPPTLIEASLDDSSQDHIFSDEALASATLHVPSGCIDNYTSDDYWAFSNIVEIADTVASDLEYTEITPTPYLSWDELETDEPNYSLTQITITYGETVYLSDDTLTATVTHVSGDITLTAEAAISDDDPNSVVLTFDDLVSYEGSWYVTVPEGFIIDAIAYETDMQTGSQNPALELWYYVETAPVDYSIYSQNSVTIEVSPAEGNVEKLGTIKLTFPDFDYAERKLTTVYLYNADDSLITTGTVASNAATGGNVFTITLETTVTEEGTYTLNVPSGTFSLYSDPNDYPVSCDLNFTWTIGDATGINTVVVAGEGEGVYDVYTVGGVRVMSTDDASQLNSLPAGLYIINGKKHVLK